LVSIADPDPAFNFTADPVPGPGSQTNADPDSDADQAFILQKIEFFNEKYTLLNRSQNLTTYVCTKVF
jgi:hypothetical protein